MDLISHLALRDLLMDYNPQGFLDQYTELNNPAGYLDQLPDPDSGLVSLDLLNTTSNSYGFSIELRLLIDGIAEPQSYYNITTNLDYAVHAVRYSGVHQIARGSNPYIDLSAVRRNIGEPLIRVPDEYPNIIFPDFPAQSIEHDLSRLIRLYPAPMSDLPLFKPNPKLTEAPVEQPKTENPLLEQPASSSIHLTFDSFIGTLDLDDFRGR